MKALFICCCLLFTILLPYSAMAQDPIIEAVKAAVKKVIKAVDLKVQRLQNKTIWLQNAQKTIENILSETKLKEISDWVEKHREQYAEYYDELKKVKQIVSGYYEVKEIIRKQLAIIETRKKFGSLFKNDQHFSSSDIAHFESVFTGIVEQSVDNLEELYRIITAYSYQMSDEERIAAIRQVSGNMDVLQKDLEQFCSSNQLASVQRAKDAQEIQRLKLYYGIQ